MSSTPNRLRTVLAGCGALSELYYAPALAEAARHTPLEVVGVCDPNAERRAVLLRSFPSATGVTSLEPLLALKPELGIVASPPKFHAEQTNALLRAGVHVLCEKPMASTVTEAETMLATARETKRLLAIGLFRRFFPALQNIKALIANQSLGAPKSFHFSEGGAFNWPAASASFFQKAQSQGGVLADLGVHVLDLVCWWFGEPTELAYEDDAMGNLEANCEVSLKFSNSLTGIVRLSRDTAMSNRYVIEFERGRVTWKVGDGNRLDVQMAGTPFAMRGELMDDGSPAATYHQSFVHQLFNFAAAARGKETLRVPGEEGIHSLRLIEECYARRTLMPMPWFADGEWKNARALAAV